MTPHPQLRTVSRNRNRTRRFSPCNRHPSEPVTALCALCLRDRLAGLDSSSGQFEVEKVVVCSRRTVGHGVGSSSAPVPELSRSKSVVGEKCLDNLVVDPRRNSCDVRVRRTLSHLFIVDDEKKSRNGFATVESMNLGFSGIGVVEEEDNDDDDEIRASDDVIGRNETDGDDEVIEGDLKTMKEIIDKELDNKRRNPLDAGSVFSLKLRNWRQKQTEKKQSGSINGGIENESSKLEQWFQFRDTQSEVADYGFGRRSCDTEPRVSIDAHRFSLDEHRASIVDNMMLAHENKFRSSYGGSAKSNSESYNLNRRSGSSLITSSIAKAEGFGGGDVKSASNASNARVSPASDDVIFQGTKLVITEKELRDWHLNSLKKNSVECFSNAPPDSTSKTSPLNESSDQKKVITSRWRKVCNLLGNKQKLDDKKNFKHIPENRVEIGNSNAKLARNPSFINSRNRRDAFVLDRNRSKRYSTSDLDSGLLRLYLTPFRNNSRRNKTGKSRVPSMATNGFQMH